MSLWEITQSPTAKKLESFANLPAGWRYGQGGPISHDRIIRAVGLLRFMALVGFTRTDAFPGADGEIMLAAYHGEHYLTLVIEADNSISFTHEAGGVQCCAFDNRDDEQAKQLVRQIAGEIWPTFDWFIPTNTTQFAAHSLTWHSKSLLTAECRSSSEGAQKQQAVA